MLDYINFYYENVLGYYPSDEFVQNSQKVIEYLKDNNFSDKEIVQALEYWNLCEQLKFEDIPNKLYENSLLEKDKFYYHRTLRLSSPMPKWNPQTDIVKTNKFYLEMRIRFTIDDLIQYFYDTVGIDPLFWDEKKTKGAFEYLLNKYKNKFEVEPIDVLLSLIDMYKDTKKNIEVFDLESNLEEVVKRLTTNKMNAELEKCNNIVWR